VAVVVATVVALVVAAIVGTGSGPGGDGPRADAPVALGLQRTVARQSGAPGAVDLRLAFVSPSVPPTGTFELRFEPTADIPRGSVLEVRFHRQITNRSQLRERVAAIADGGSPGGTVRPPVRVPDGLLGNPLAGWRLELRVTDVDQGGDEIVLPDDGIVPVSLDLVDAAGAPLWEQTVFMVRPPADRPLGRDGRPAEFAVTAALALDADPTIDLDGTSTLDEELLGRVDQVADLLAAVPEFPFSLALEPNLLSGLDRSGTRSATALSEAVQQPGLRGRSLRRPDVPVDTGGIIRANGLDVLEELLQTGEQVVEEATLRAPVDSTWLLDETVDPESLPALESLGVRRVVLPAERIERPGDVDDDAARWRTMALADSATVTGDDPTLTPLTVIADDPILSLLSLDASISPGVAANRISTELAAEWFTAVDADTDAFPGPQTFMFVPPQVDPALLLALGPALDGTGVLRADPAADPPPAAPIDGEVAVATVADRDPAPQEAAIAEYRSTQRLIGGVRSIVGLAEPDVTTWSLLNSQSMSVAVPEPERAATHTSIAGQARALLDGIQGPADSSVVVGNSQATIPLRFTNSLPYPVDVELRIRSNRVEVRGGDRQRLRLEPGDTPVELAVEVRAGGVSTVRYDLTSPDGTVGITSFTTEVRATRFSGVGAGLSILSLVVLAWWWISTALRRRRQSARAAGHHPSESVTSAGSGVDGSVTPRG